MANKNEPLLSDFFNSYFNFEESNHKAMEEDLKKVWKSAEKIIEEILEKNEILEFNQSVDAKFYKKMEIEIIGKLFYLLVEAKENGMFKCSILDETQTTEFETVLPKVKVAKSIEELLKETIQNQKMKNASNPPKKFLTTIIGFSEKLVDAIWIDLIDNYSNVEIETQCFEILKRKKVGQIMHVSTNYTFFMSKIFNYYYTVSYHKETKKFMVSKSLNQEEAILSYNNLILNQIKEEISAL